MLLELIHKYRLKYSHSLVGFRPVQLYLQLNLLRSAVCHMRQKDTCRLSSRIRCTVPSPQNTRRSEGRPQVRADRSFDLYDPSRSGDTLVLMSVVKRMALKSVCSLAGRYATGGWSKRFLPICLESTSRFDILSLHLPFRINDREQL